MTPASRLKPSFRVTVRQCPFVAHRDINEIVLPPATKLSTGRVTNGHKLPFSRSRLIWRAPVAEYCNVLTVT